MKINELTKSADRGGEREVRGEKEREGERERERKKRVREKKKSERERESLRGQEREGWNHLLS